MPSSHNKNDVIIPTLEVENISDQRILNSRERKCGMAHNLKKWKQSRILMLGS